VLIKNSQAIAIKTAKKALPRANQGPDRTAQRNFPSGALNRRKKTAFTELVELFENLFLEWESPGEICSASVE
jgi:hypothetical protein